MPKRKRKQNKFWNKEYSDKNKKKNDTKYLAISTNPSEDLEKFMRWLKRQDDTTLPTIDNVVDLGCGNGRNIIYLAREFGVSGVGIDISDEAIVQAQNAGKDLSLTFYTQSIVKPIPTKDNSASLVLDMMTSHFLNEKERTELLKEILRVLKPGGLLFWKTFLLDEDRHAKRLLREHPADEVGSYIHPQIGVAEHVFTEDEIREILEPHFIIHKVYKSHRHLKGGKAFKRRSIVVYAEKK